MKREKGKDTLTARLLEVGNKLEGFYSWWRHYVACRGVSVTQTQDWSRRHTAISADVHAI